MTDQLKKLNELISKQTDELSEQRIRLQMYSSEITELKENGISGRESELFALVSESSGGKKAPNTPQKSLAIAYQVSFPFLSFPFFFWNPNRLKLF